MRGSTAILAELRAGAVHREGPYHAWPNQGWGIELEVGDFLWGLVRALRPKLILESGTGIGISTRFLGAACKENRRGRVITFEPNDTMAERARSRLEGLPVEIRGGNTLDWAGQPPHLVFLDSYPPEMRKAEMAHWLGAGVLLGVHDAHRYELPPGLLFPTPRGMWLGRGPGNPA